MHNFDNYQYVLTFISSNVDVNDNPQSPSYPALPFLRRKIQPNEGGSPFNVPVTWYGRPLGSEYASPFSPKDIKQFNLNFIVCSIKVELLRRSYLTTPADLNDPRTIKARPSLGNAI